jgi:nicotinate-nucleotide pyrophosphorylase (carboxylating)
VRARAAVVAKEDCIVAGTALFEPLVEALAARGREDEDAGSLHLADAVRDGSSVEAGATVCIVEGAARAVLTLERTFLNFLGRLCGVATLTARYVEVVRATGATSRVLDTRKTTPGHRLLEKYAVRCGGGFNHRIGLFDGILIKDNHVAVAGSVHEAVRRAREAAPEGMVVEVECDHLGQLDEALDAGAQAILLDNFMPADVARAVEIVAGRARVEVSGGINLNTIAAYAAAGPDDISVGRLTHSATSIDLGMDILLTP